MLCERRESKLIEYCGRLSLPPVNSRRKREKQKTGNRKRRKQETKQETENRKQEDAAAEQHSTAHHSTAHRHTAAVQCCLTWGMVYPTEKNTAEVSPGILTRTLTRKTDILRIKIVTRSCSCPRVLSAQVLLD